MTKTEHSPSSATASAFASCPICAEVIKPADLCASDIEMGTCHAACLNGSPVVDLETGAEIEGGTVDIWRYGDDPLAAFIDAQPASIDEKTSPSSIHGDTLSWRCFHCDDVFHDERSAKMHFGYTEDSAPACKIKAGAEGSLVTALRRAESELADAWASIHNETTEAAKAYYAQQSRHGDQLRATEELGYERGLADGRAENPSPSASLSGSKPVKPLLATRFKLSFNSKGNCTTFRKDQAEALEGEWVWLVEATNGMNDPLFATLTPVSSLSGSEKPIAHLVWLQGHRGPDDVEDYYEVARPGDKSVDGSDPFPVYAQDANWKDDPSSDERWQAGLDFGMTQLCNALKVDPQSVTWDAATETLDGDVRAVLLNILRGHFGEDWGPSATAAEGA